MIRLLKTTLSQLANSRRTFWPLFLGYTAYSAILVFWVSARVASNDQQSYLALVDGLRQGVFSEYSFLDPAPPETFRSPGYPLFLLGVRIVSASRWSVLIVQLGLLLGTVLLGAKVADRLCGATGLARNLVVAFAFPSAQLPFYAGLLYPETLMAALLMAYVAVEVLVDARRVWLRRLCTGALWGVTILVRPIFLFLPLFVILADAFVLRRRLLVLFRERLLPILVAGVILLPYAAWNRYHHGIWTVLPVEGAAANVLYGFWQHRLPGYAPQRYWPGTHMGDEVFPLTRRADVPRHAAAFEADWDEIYARARPFLSTADRERAGLMAAHPELFATCSTAYTLARRRAVEAVVLRRVLAEPGYYLATRLYTGLRLWVTGIDKRRLRGARSSQDVLWAVYPTLATAGLFAGLAYSLSLLLRRQLPLSSCATALWTILYCWLAHLPVSIQSRYTVPVHPLVFTLVAASIATSAHRRACSTSAGR